MVVDENDGNGERGHIGTRRNPSRAKPDRSGDPINRMVVRRAASARTPNGCVATADPPATARRWPTLTSPPTVRSRPLDGLPAAPAVTHQPAGSGPTANISSRASAASARAQAAQPGPGTNVQRLLVGRPVDGGRAPRGLELGAQRRDDGLGRPGAPPGRARASPRAPRSAARALRGWSAAARRAAARGPRARRGPASAPSATACSVVDVGPQPVRQPLEQVGRQRRHSRRSCLRRAARPRARPCGRAAPAPLPDPAAPSSPAASRPLRRSAPRPPRARPVEPVPRGAAPPGRR